MSNANSSPVEAAEDVAVNKRYERLLALRTKAVKGKGAWYWAHFDPILITNPDTNHPKSVKLKCTLCDAAFSASNPSRTASEHLKRGACPNFSFMLKPITQLPPLASPSSQRKRSSDSSLDVSPINMFDSSRLIGFMPHQSRQLQGPSPKPPILSGGRDDLRPLAMLEESVKRLKSPKASPTYALSKEQVDAAFDLLADWFFEVCGSVTFSSLEHPKFTAFLKQVGMPEVSRRELLCSRLDSKFEEARRASEARIRDAAFFQVASDGWKSQICIEGDKRLVKFMVNLPNGTRVFQKVVCSNGEAVPSQHAEEVLWETVGDICGGNAHRCVGIVADRYKGKALKSLEHQNNWMVNLSCQIQGFCSLIKDFTQELPLFVSVTEKCMKIANLINSQSQVRNSFLKFRLQGVEVPAFITVPTTKRDISKNSGPFIAMLEGVLTCSQILRLVVLDDTFKVACLEDLAAAEVAGVVQDVGFWNEVEAAHSLIKLLISMAEEVEAERPLVGRCLPLWEQMRSKIKEWCTKCNVAEGPVERIVERRFKKNYHPAWSAAFILDPQYLVRDASGKYLPPFKCLTHEQEQDVEQFITRLVAGEEAHIALMELMKWRSEGLEPLYAQAVQLKQQDPVTGKMKIAHPQSSRLVWETCLKEFKSLSKVAVRLLFLQATSSGIKWDWSFTKLFGGQGASRLGFDKVQKLIFVAAHAKLERQDFSSVEENDAELLRSVNGEDEMLNEVLAQTSSI
ncbi:hypothetical protein SASPL_110700 [Salvia splendens]|uniref:DUF7963 domain-containing protein n=1 Tax=Salvia splendens TaxID=180675 RepID=A0A8X9A2M8_SALSN|nr:uncharacterized protein LOC121797619 [Salvia splendens]KAG6426477.1 hypothetical protein SASPL_110700 [Salvia splendens]